MRKYAILSILVVILTGCPGEADLNVSVKPPDGGTVTPNQIIHLLNETITVEAVPTDGWLFSHWEGDLSGSTNPVKVKMNSNKFVTAVFIRALLSAVINLPASDVTIEVGQSVDFWGAASGGTPPYSYSWSFGTGSGIGDFSFADPGQKQFNNIGTFEAVLTVTDSEGDQASDIVTVTVTAPATGLEDGLISLGMNNPDGIQLVVDSEWAGITSPYLLIAGGYDGILGVDPATGDELLSDFYMEFAEVLGAFGLRAPSTQPETADNRDLLVEFGNGGCRIVPYNAAIGEWGSPQWIHSSSPVTDAVPFNNVIGSNGFIYTVKFSQVAFVKYDDTLDSWDFESVYYNNSFPDFASGFMSAFARSLEGTILAVEDGSPGELYMHNRTTAVSIGNVGNSPRKIRCLDEVCAVTNFGDDTISLISWDAGDNCSITDTVTVGDGPIGVDLIELQNGNIGILTTGFNDNTITITEVTPGAVFVSSDTLDVPTGLTQPGHAVWVKDGSMKVMISGYGSNNVAIMSSGM